MTLRSSLLLAAGILLMAPIPAASQCPPVATAILPEPPEPSTLNHSSFGEAVLLDGDELLVGSPRFGGASARRGAFLAFERNGDLWQESQRIEGVGPHMALFGGLLSRDGALLVVGANGCTFSSEPDCVSNGTTNTNDELRAYAYASTPGGWVHEATFDMGFSLLLPSLSLKGPYAFIKSESFGLDQIVVYQRDDGLGTWAPVQTLDHPEGPTNPSHGGPSAMGQVVALSPERMVLSSPRSQAAQVDFAGKIFVFERIVSTWVVVDSILVPGLPENGHLGFRMTGDGNRLLASAHAAFAPFAEPPTVYVIEFDGAGWVVAGQLPSPPPGQMKNFPTGLALEGDRAMVTSQRDDGSDAWLLHHYEKGVAGWHLIQTVPVVGSSVSLSGDRVAVGSAPTNDFGGAQVLELDPWPFVEAPMLTPNDNFGGSHFGSALALSGTRLLVGAPEDNQLGSAAGAAYVMEFDGDAWVHSQKLLAPDAAAGDYFGEAVALEGDRAVIGASRDTPAGSLSGSVRVFERTAGVWTQTATIVPADLEQGDRFGFGVALAGDWLAVSATQEDDAGSGAGAVYVFRRVGGVWTEMQKLFGSDINGGDQFGRGLAMDGQRLVAGAPYVHPGFPASNIGAAYVFERSGDTWAESARLAAADGGNLDYFGWAVALDGDRIAVGAYGDDDAANDAGAAYVYAHDGAAWAQEAKLFAANPGAVDRLGQVLHLRNGVLAAGVVNDAEVAFSAGAVHVFARNAAGWSHVRKLTAADGASLDRLGYAVATDGERVLTGVYGDSQGGAGQQGSVRDFRLTCAASTVVSVPPALPRQPPSSLSLWPNPIRANGPLTLRRAPGHVPARVEVFDTRGRRVRHWHLPPAGQSVDVTIDLQGLAPGLYLIRTREGVLERTGRVVVLD